MKMKSISILAFALCAVALMTSCKSRESAYKKAYEKAQAQAAQTQQTVATTVPTNQNVQIAPVATQTQTVDVSNEPVRTESVNLISGPALKAYSVICGSFSLKANAEGLQQTLKNAGYDAQIAFSSARSMYRVIASTYNDKESAVRSRNDLRSKYADAWLLYNQQ